MILLIPIVMILAGLALQTALRWMYGARGPAKDDTLYLAGRVFSWLLIGGGVALWLLLPVAAVIVCVMLWVIAGFALVDAVQSARHTQRRMVAKVLAIAQREGQLKQAAELIDQLPAGHFVADAARGMAYQLASGTPLYESVASHRGAVPAVAPAWAAIGTLAGDEPAALEQMCEPGDPNLVAAWRTWLDYTAYFIAATTTMVAVLSFVMLFIIPQFEQIFFDFDLELPATTMMLITAFGASPLFVVLGGMMIVLLVGLLIVGGLYLLDFAPLDWVANRLFRQSHIASVLRMIALAVEHRVEMPRALYAVSVTYPVRAIRTRLSAAYQATAAGRPWAQALAESRLLSEEEQALVDTAEAVGNVPWALRQIAGRRESRSAARLNVATRIALPALIVVLGLAVAVIVVALFIPLMSLVEGLT